MAFVQRPDGVRIAYETRGSGPPVILLHGGGQSRRTWVEAGYVEALARRFRVIAIDARGHGESDKPTERARYDIETVMGDVLAVADACAAPRFDLVGYSYGGNIGRFLASRTDRVTCFVLIGIGFGLGIPQERRAGVEATLAPWAAVVGPNPDPDALPPDRRAMWDHGAIRPMLAWFGALLDWPATEPAELRCPTLWLVGSQNEVGALDNFHAHRANFAEHDIQGVILDGLDHAAEMTATGTVLPLIDGFLV